MAKMLSFSPLAIAAAALLVACEVPPAPPPVCGGFDPVSLTLVAGGRTRIELEGALADELTSVSSDGVDALRLDDAIVIRAGYETHEASVELVCTTGTVQVPVTVVPLRMTPLLAWDATDDTSPAAREYFAWWMDPTGARALYLYGGFVYEPRQFTPSSETWRLDLTTLEWSTLSNGGTPPPPGGRVAPGIDGAVFYLGGATLGLDGSLETPRGLASVTTTGSDATWADAPSATTAPGSYTGALVYDSARARWLSVCGVDTSRLGIHCRVHEYTPETGFVPLEIDGDAEAPQGRYGFHYAYDAETDRVIIHGGQTGQGEDEIASDTWALELATDGDATRPRWVRLAEDASISARRNGAFALDPEGHRMFVWGGTRDGRSALPGLDVLSLERGSESWTHVELPANVPPRASGGGVYDPAAHRILFGFGNSDALYTDLYALELAPPDGV